MDLIGSFEGYTVTSMDIYNRGVFGSGYSISNIVLSPSQSGYENGSVTAEASAIKLYSPTSQTDHHYNITYGCYVNKLINFAPYKTLNITLSHTYTNAKASGELIIGVGSKAGNVELASMYYVDSFYEKTFSLDVSKVTVSGYIYFDYYKVRGDSDDESYEKWQHTSYIHRIWFS